MYGLVPEYLDQLELHLPVLKSLIIYHNSLACEPDRPHVVFPILVYTSSF
jgi:hypothetical protein